MQREQPTEIEIPAIHHIGRASFDGQHIQYIDLVGLAVRDVDKGGNVAAKIQRSLGGTKRRPWEQRQAQVDGRGIQGVDRVVQVDAEAVVAIQLARTPDEQGGQVGPDAPVASLVGIVQCRTPDRHAKAHAVQLGLIGQQTGFDVAQALALSQLCEGHGTELLGATQLGATQTSNCALGYRRHSEPRFVQSWSMARTPSAARTTSCPSSLLTPRGIDLWKLREPEYGETDFKSAPK